MSSLLGLIEFLRNTHRRHYLALSHTFVASVIIAILSLATNVVWTRLFDPEVFGAFRLILSFATTISAFSLMGISTAIMISVADKADRDVKHFIKNKTLINIALALVLFLSLSFYSFKTEITYLDWDVILICSILYPIYNMTDIWSSWLNSKRQFFRLACGRCVRAGLYLSTVFTFGFFAPQSFFFLIFCFLFLIGIQNLWELRHVNLNLHNTKLNPKTISYGNHLSFALIFSSLGNADILLLGFFFTTNEIALYTIILIFPELIKSAWSVFNQVLSPFAFSEKSAARYWEKFKKVFLLLIIGWSFLALIGFILIPYIVDFLFTQKYTLSGYYGKFIWLVYCLTAPCAFFANSVLASQNKNLAYIQQAGYPILAFTLFASLIAQGIEGLVIARIILSLAISGFHVFSFIWLIRNVK